MRNTLCSFFAVLCDCIERNLNNSMALALFQKCYLQKKRTKKIFNFIFIQLIRYANCCRLCVESLIERTGNAKII